MEGALALIDVRKIDESRSPVRGLEQELEQSDCGRQIEHLILRAGPS